MPKKSSSKPKKATKATTAKTKNTAKTKPSTTKKAVAKKTSTTKSSSTKKTAPQGLWQQWVAQRDQFFQDHPNAKWLLAILLIVVGVWFYVQIRVYSEMMIYHELRKEGIEYEPKILPFQMGENKAEYQYKEYKMDK